MFRTTQSDIPTLFIWTLEFIYIVFYITGVVLFLSRKNYEPIKSRKPWIVILETLGWFLWCVLRGIFRGTSPLILCAIDIILPQVCLFLGTTVLFVRTVHLWCQYHVTVESVKLMHQGKNVGKNLNRSKASEDDESESEKDRSTMRRSLKLNDNLGNLELKSATCKSTGEHPKHICKLKRIESASKQLVLLNITNQKQALSTTRKAEDGDLSFWYLSHRRWFTSRMLLLYIVICVSVESAALIVPIFLNSTTLQVYRNDGHCPPFQTIGSWIGQSWMTLSAVTCLIVSYKIRVVDERLGMKSELRIITASLTAITLTLAINLLTGRNIEFWIENESGVSLLVPFVVVIFTGIIQYVSLFCSWKKTLIFEYGKKLIVFDSSSAVEEELLHCLNDPIGFLLFENHLKQELAVENILFWRDLELFRMKEIDALTIYENYIRESSPFPVGISSETRIAIEKYFELDAATQDARLSESELFDSKVSLKHLPEVSKDIEATRKALENLHHIPDSVFDKAYKELFRNMVDPFMRFKDTPEYEDFKRSARQRRSSSV